MKFIGQHIVDLIARFRSDLYLENISSGTIASGSNLGLDSNNKVVKADIIQNTIKILPSDFLSNEDGGVNKSLQFDDSGTIGVVTTHDNSELYAFVRIPLGKKAANVTIFGSDTSNTVEVFEANINSSGLTDKTPGGGCVVGSACNFTNVTGGDTNYLVVKINTAEGDDNVNRDVVYGGFVTIT